MQDLSNKQHFVGCDVSKATLDLALHKPKTDFRNFEHIRVSNDDEGFRQLSEWLRSKGIKRQNVAIGMEHTGSYSMAIAEWLHKKKIAFCLLHPIDVKNACSRGRNKTDVVDSQFIADYIYTLREKLTPSIPEPTDIKRMRELRSERNLCVRTRTAYICQKKTKTDSKAIARIEKQIASINNHISLVEAEIRKVIEADKNLNANYKLLTSIPGVGFVNAINTLIATGNFTRFQTSRQYAKFCCVSPLTIQSGTSVNGGDHVSKKGHNELKAALSEAARSASIHDSQIRNYYIRKKEQGKSHGCIMNAIKFKLICRMFAVIRRQQPYVNTELYRSAKP